MTQSHFTGGTIVPPAPSLASRGGVVGKHHFTGELVADFSGARVVYFESHLEMQVLEVLRARPDVADVAEQPPRVTWRDGSGVVRHHTFDFLVTLRSGERVAVAVKPVARVISSGVRVALAEIAAQIDPAFAARIVLVTDRDIDPVEVRNATLLTSRNWTTEALGRAEARLFTGFPALPAEAADARAGDILAGGFVAGGEPRAGRQGGPGRAGGWRLREADDE